MIFIVRKRWKDRILDLFHKEDGGEIDFADDVNISEEFIQKWKRK